MTTSEIRKGHFHQLEATISVPTRPDLLRELFTAEQLVQIADKIGQTELFRLSDDRDHTPQNEARNLETVRKAIHAVTGHAAPWIIGYASEFGKGLRTALTLSSDDGYDLAKEEI